MALRDDDETMAGPLRERRARRGQRGSGASNATPRARTRLHGGRYAPLDSADVAAIQQGAFDILESVGMGDVPAAVMAMVTAAGGRPDAGGRLLFPRDLVTRAIAALARPLTLCGQDPAHDLLLADRLVHAGSGGAAPLIVDLETGRYRPSTLKDLHDAARMVDALENVHFFSRSVVARDMPDAMSLDVNTAFASLAGTSKHVMVAVQDDASVAAIAEMCALVAGSADAFHERPFLSLNINHVVPPLRFSGDAVLALMAAARAGIPCHVNTFGQLGASSPVTIAGCLAQTMAETLAGMVVAWLAAPDVRAIFGVRPMITDLRTGGMAGGAGEQALLTAAAVQVANAYGLPNSTIAGATDSKIGDAQSGYEKALSVTLAAQAGANMITQACGMQAGLMAASLESYVIDNEMLGAILRSLAPVEVSAATLSPAMIGEVVRGEGHFLGHADTLARMQTDFLYPRLADRRPPDQWEADGARDIRQLARERARDILASHHPQHLSEDVEAALRARFDIRLPRDAVRPA